MVPERDPVTEHRFGSCALVGNAGVLLNNKKTGKAIDAHEMVRAPPHQLCCSPGEDRFIRRHASHGRRNFGGETRRAERGGLGCSQSCEGGNIPAYTM
eukprot:3606433-Pyramimonas_sp.AAC.1